MKTYVPRTVRKIGSGHSRSQPKSLPIEAFRSEAAYVLLGPPGSGKTTIFKQEETKRQGQYVTARDFNTYSDMPQWHNTTLFIDGLDETRAGQSDGRTPFDKIRAKLNELRCPRFRLSCREADWFGTTDRERLKAISPDRNITVLRIDPLSDNDIHRILQDNLDIADAEIFINTAREKGVQGLLTNPKSLEMLALAVHKGGDWPNARIKTFSMACEALVVEHNPEHGVFVKELFGTPELIEASGRLYALLLLTGSAGFSLPGTKKENDLIALEQLPEQNKDIYLHCLHSKLFESPAFGHVMPVHRQVTEFLAGRYLAGLVDNHQPAGRILALCTGHDGMVVSGLRGLTAWFAAHNRHSRAEIMYRDPLGVVLYGDIKHFSPDEKRCLLNRLLEEIKASHRSIDWFRLDSRLGDLVTSDMIDQIKIVLNAPSRDKPSQTLTLIVLKALNHADPVPGMTESLMKILRDETWWPSVRLNALDVLICYREIDHNIPEQLRHLTDDIFHSQASGRDDTLLDDFLSRLYPDVISETTLMKYLRISRKPGANSEGYFWTYLLPKKSNKEQLAILLDQLIERYDTLPDTDSVSKLPVASLHSVALALLARLLDLSEDNIDPSRLFHWLRPASLEADWDDWSAYQRDDNDIRNWFENHPSTWKALLLMGIKRYAGLSKGTESDEFSFCVNKEKRNRLFDATPPCDFGLWCLDQAITTEDEKIVDWFLKESAECLHYLFGNEDLSHDVVLEHLADHPKLRDKYDVILHHLQTQTEPKKDNARSRIGCPDWHDHVKPYQDALRSNRASPVLLHQLAKVYLGGYSGLWGNTPRERLNSLLRDDDCLVQDVLTGFRITIKRNDLPTYKQILRLGIRNRTHYLAYPIMAGLEEISDPKQLNAILTEERIIQLVLSIHYSVPMWLGFRDPADRPPFWFDWLLATYPKVVADVLVRFTLARWRNGKEASVLFGLANSKKYEHVAHLITMTLLEKFPIRCTSGQLSNLSHLLLSADNHCQHQSIVNVIDKKLVRDGMNIAQRIHWLTAGLCLSPDTYLKKTESYVAGKERRIRFLAEAVGRLSLPRSMQCRQSVAVLRLLIQLIGTAYRPYSLDDDSEEARWHSPEMDAAEQVEHYIKELATMASSDATDAIQTLLYDANLRSWRSRIMDAAHRQKPIRREAEFNYFALSQVLATLDRKSPANAPDLAALTYEKLKEIGHDLHHGNASGWRQYWNVDRYTRPQRPRPEDACRDSLVCGLQLKLDSFGIDVQPEGRYVNDKRADIRVAYHGFNVPVEIKKSCHRDLWSAIRTQLIAAYARDPGASGYGIYLVLWFGNTEYCHLTPPPAGSIPTNPVELEERLKLSLPADEKFKIRVCVMDVAKPNRPG